MLGRKHKIVNKDWGNEVWIVNATRAGYCGKAMFVRNVWSSKGRYHYHLKKDETFYVLSGVLLLDIYGDMRYRLNPTNSFRIRPNIAHRFRAEGANCTFIEFSTYHCDSDSYYL